MKMLTSAICPLLFIPNALAQNPQPPKAFTDPIALLRTVAKTYATDTSTFHIESIEESVETSPFERDWKKTHLMAIKGPGDLFRIEARTPFGSWTMDSDGVHQWLYEADSNVYTEKPSSPVGPAIPKIAIFGEVLLDEAWQMRSSLEMTATRFKHATMLMPQTILIGGHSFLCYVVHATNKEGVIGNTDEQTFTDDTFWIDKKALVFRKVVSHEKSYDLFSREVHLPKHWDITTVYPVVDFHPEIAREAFRFVPPTGAKQMAKLESSPINEVPSISSVSLVGKPAPDVTLVSAGGKRVQLSSYRGKPVLLDLWATWCGPCLVSLPALDRLYNQMRGKDVAVITVDRDSAAGTATAYLARHDYAWTNYHDPNGLVGKAFHVEAIPLTVLIDAQGKVVYEDFGGNDTALRKAISALGPQFVPLASAAE